MSVVLGLTNPELNTLGRRDDRQLTLHTVLKAKSPTFGTLELDKLLKSHEDLGQFAKLHFAHLQTESDTVAVRIPWDKC